MDFKPELLPTKEEKKANLTYIYDPASRGYDIIDLNTGLNVEKSDYSISPVIYSLQIADKMCDFIRDGLTLDKMCKEEGMPTKTRFYHWLTLYPELRTRYEHARLQRADAFHDKAVEIGTSMPSKDELAGAKLAVDTLKWAAEKASPNYYGVKKEEVVTNAPTVIVLNTGINRESAPSIEDLLRKMEPVTIEAHVIPTNKEEDNGNAEKEEN